MSDGPRSDSVFRGDTGPPAAAVSKRMRRLLERAEPDGPLVDVHVLEQQGDVAVLLPDYAGNQVVFGSSMMVLGADGMLAVPLTVTPEQAIGAFRAGRRSVLQQESAGFAERARNCGPCCRAAFATYWGQRQAAAGLRPTWVRGQWCDGEVLDVTEQWLDSQLQPKRSLQAVRDEVTSLGVGAQAVAAFEWDFELASPRGHLVNVVTEQADGAPEGSADGGVVSAVTDAVSGQVFRGTPWFDKLCVQVRAAVFGPEEMRQMPDNWDVPQIR